MKNLIILGPPGSGKDTQIAKLAEYMSFQVISGGDIVRSLSKNNSTIRKTMEAGGLIDDAVMLAEVDKRLTSLDREIGLVFDGFPRDLHQAETLNEVLLHHDRALDTVIYLALEEGEIVDRLSRRKVCSICGHNMHAGSTKCADCGGRPVRRPDDEPAVIIKRVQTFLENTLPLVGYYRNKGILLEINGNRSIADVAGDIKGRLITNDRG